MYSEKPPFRGQREVPTRGHRVKGDGKEVVSGPRAGSVDKVLEWPAATTLPLITNSASVLVALCLVFYEIKYLILSSALRWLKWRYAGRPWSESHFVSKVRVRSH